MNDHQDDVSHCPDRPKPPLPGIGIVVRDRKRIVQGKDGCLEADSVLLYVGAVLVIVPGPVQSAGSRRLRRWYLDFVSDHSPDIQFPGNDVGDQPGTVLLHQFDLAAGAAGCFIYETNPRRNLMEYSTLFLNWAAGLS